MNLDLFLQICSIAFTVLLAAVGIEMANHPPTNKTERIVYRTIFSVVGLCLIWTTYWQGVRNIDAQKKIQSDANNQAIALKGQYDSLKSENDEMHGQLNTITSLVKNPPKDANAQQLSESIQTMLKAGKQKQTGVPADAIMPVETIRELLGGLQANNSKLTIGYMQESSSAERYCNLLLNGGPEGVHITTEERQSREAQCKDRKKNLDDKYDGLQQQWMRGASYLYDHMLPRIPLNGVSPAESTEAEIIRSLISKSSHSEDERLRTLHDLTELMKRIV